MPRRRSRWVEIERLNTWRLDADLRSKEITRLAPAMIALTKAGVSIRVRASDDGTLYFEAHRFVTVRR